MHWYSYMYVKYSSFILNMSLGYGNKSEHNIQSVSNIEFSRSKYLKCSFNREQDKISVHLP